MEKLATKKNSRFNRLFDIGILSHASERFIGEGSYSDLFKDKARIYAESGDFLVVLKVEQKVKFR